MNKEYIIKEITRTANENSGMPLGARRFGKETGINQNDWLGKYWSKWSDALIEAGFIPNKMQSAYDESKIIEHVMSLIKELGKLPSAAEIRFKAHTNPGFPFHNTIQSRLGKQKELAQKIIVYCERNQTDDDVRDITIV